MAGQLGTVVDGGDGAVTILAHHAQRKPSPVLFLDDGRRLASAEEDGVLRVGSVTDDEPHLLVGHRGNVGTLARSPDGTRIASTGDDRTVRVWPVPQGLPFHALPYATLLARLRGLTTARAVPDAADPSGYRIQVTPIRGWGAPPGW